MDCSPNSHEPDQLADAARNRPLPRRGVSQLVAILAGALLAGCGNDDRLPLNVELGGRTVSKLPFVIALDLGLYEKYGLDADVRIPEPAYPDGIRTHSVSLPAQGWRALTRRLGAETWQSDIFVDGHTPNIVKFVERANWPHRVAIAATDCVARAHIVARHGIDSLEQLKNARLGISGRRDTTTGFMALTLAERMGWDPVLDISIMYDGRDVDDLREGRVDAIVASETRYAVALREGFPVLADLSEWGVALGGNSVMVEEGWLDDPTNREAAKRFLKATVEGLALFHTNRELAVDVMMRWYGITDRQEAETIYERGRFLERRGYPCYAGIDNTLALYESSELRKHAARDFFDDSLLRELDASGFIDEVYESATR